MPDRIPSTPIHEDVFSLHPLLEKLIQTPHPTPDKLFLHDHVLPALLPALEELIRRVEKHGKIYIENHTIEVDAR